MSRVERVFGFQLFVFLSASANFILLSLLGRSYLPFLALNAAALLWYGAIAGTWRRKIAGRHLLLLKYPAFVWLIAPVQRPGAELLVSMSIVYICCSIYEVFHDRAACAR